MRVCVRVCVCVITFILEADCVLCELRRETEQTVSNTNIRIEHDRLRSLLKLRKGSIGTKTEPTRRVNGLPSFPNLIMSTNRPVIWKVV